MVWENPDFQKYFRGLLLERQEKASRDAQQTLQKFHADAARIGCVSGVHVAYTAGSIECVLRLGGMLRFYHRTAA